MGKVAARLGKIGLQANRFLKLADRFVSPALHAQSRAKVVVGLGKTGVEPDGFPELVDRFVHLGLVTQGSPKVVMSLGNTGVQSNGFLKLADCFVGLAFPFNGETEIVMRQLIVPGDCKRMPEKRFTVLPIPELFPRHPQAQNHHRTTRNG